MKRLHDLSFITTGLLLALPLILILSTTSLSQEITQKQVLEFAQKSLDNYLNQFLNEENVTKFGFKSLDEAQSARLGKPFKVMFIGLKDLKAYEPGASAKSLMKDVKTLWFPVMIGEEIRAKLEIIEKDGQWIAGDFGEIKTSRKIAGVKAQLPELLKAKNISMPENTFLVNIPVLNAKFFYIDNAEGEFLVPASFHSHLLKLQEGQIYPAHEVLSQLKDIAKDIDENKVM